MRTILFLLISISSFSQDISPGTYHLKEVENDRVVEEVKILPDNKFEFILLTCTMNEFGMGSYQIKNDSLIFSFEEFESDKLSIDTLIMKRPERTIPEGHVELSFHDSETGIAIPGTWLHLYNDTIRTNTEGNAIVTLEQIRQSFTFVEQPYRTESKPITFDVSESTHCSVFFTYPLFIPTSEDVVSFRIVQSEKDSILLKSGSYDIEMVKKEP